MLQVFTCDLSSAVPPSHTHSQMAPHCSTLLLCVSDLLGIYHSTKQSTHITQGLNTLIGQRRQTLSTGVCMFCLSKPKTTYVQTKHKTCLQQLRQVRRLHNTSLCHTNTYTNSIHTEHTSAHAGCAHTVFKSLESENSDMHTYRPRQGRFCMCVCMSPSTLLYTS